MNGHDTSYFSQWSQQHMKRAEVFEYAPSRVLRWQIDQTIRSFERMSEAIMASKHNSKPATRPGNGNISFINTKLTSEELKKFDAWLTRQGDVDQAVAEALHDGYKFTFMQMSGENVFLANMYPGKETVMNLGLSLGSRSPNYWRAVLMCVYKHTFLCDDNDWSQLQGDNSEG